MVAPAQSIITPLVPADVLNFLTWNYPYAFEISIFWYCLGVSIRAWGILQQQANANPNAPKKSWASELVTVVMLSFGGGIICPLLMNNPPVVLKVDMAVILAAAAWWLVFHCHQLRQYLWLTKAGGIITDIGFEFLRVNLSSVQQLACLQFLGYLKDDPLGTAGKYYSGPPFM